MKQGTYSFDWRLEAAVGVLTLFLLAFAPAVVFSSSGSSSSGSSSSGRGTSSTQSSYNRYVSQNACGCYNSNAVSTAKSGGNVSSLFANSPSGVTSVSSKGTLVYSGNGLVINNVKLAGGQWVGTAPDGRSVTFAGGTTNTRDYWMYGGPVSSSGSSSGGSGSGGSPQSKQCPVYSACPPGYVTNTSVNSNGCTVLKCTVTTSTFPVLGGGSWVPQQSCTSSGKKGSQSCTTVFVWIANPPSQTSLPSGPCLTATCEGESEAFSGGGGGGEGEQLPVWIDAMPRLVRPDGSSTVEWGSTDAESCIVRFSGSTIFTGTSGREGVDGITEQRTYILQCDMVAGNTLTSSVTISIIPAWREI